MQVKRGRKKLSFQTLGHPDKSLFVMNSFLFDYISQLRGIFTKGFIRYYAIGSTIEMKYINQTTGEEIEHSLQFYNDYTTTQGREETMYLVEEFVINCYYNHEWNGMPLQTTVLSKLLNISEKSASNVIGTIRDKIYMIGKERFDY